MITSLQNPRLQEVRAYLSRSRERDAAQVFITEGVRLVEEVHSTGWPVEYLLYADDLAERGRQIIQAFRQQGVECLEVKRDILHKVSDTEHTQGILAVCKRHAPPSRQPLSFVIVIDALRDPGNLGTILRSAASANAEAIWVSPGTADPFSPKVLRAGMGAHFRLPIVFMSWEDVQANARQAHLNMYFSDAEGATALWEVDFKQPTAIIISNEAEGASDFARQCANGSVRIPMPGKFESLNAAAAASIMIFEVVRQRSST